MRTALASLLDLVFAPVCLGCAGPIAPGDSARLVCRRCRSRTRPVPAPLCERCGAPRLRTGREVGPRCGECAEWPASLRAARSACLMQPPADRLVHQLKYRGWHALARPMAERMATLRLPDDVREEARLVVPVPTTPTRLRERGYNQAERLASHFARLTGRRLLEALERAPGTTTQTVLQPAARTANVAGTFRPARQARAALAGQHCLLVDDVLTTGATAVECARTLVSAGARCVSIVTFARALDVRRLTTT